MRLRQPKPNQPSASAQQSAYAGLSATNKYWAEGDDLADARQFCLTAGAEMAAIINADRPSAPKTPKTPKAKGRDPIWLCERLTLIQRDAKRARARAVYRSAQDVLGLIQRRNAHMPIDWTRVDGRLFVLNKLLGQYEAGLSDIETIEPSTPDLIDFDPMHELAKDTLVSLLPHASETEQAALMRLVEINLAPADEEIAPASETPDLQTTEIDETESDAPQTNSVPIEWIMSDLVQRLLCVGREYGKILSVSHSLDDVHVADGTLTEVDNRLFERLSEVIAGSLPLQGVGRLDVGPSPAGLMISGSGFPAFDIPLPERVFEMDMVPTAPPAPRITDDTEAELRAQLSALMDGGPKTL